MLESLYIGATGLNAQKSQIDTISNNLTNVSTPGYKKDRLAFADLLYANNQNTNPLNGAQNMTGVRVGHGALVAASEKDFSQGEFKKTDSALDIAIRGKGFIEVEMGNGERAYTRAGSLRIDTDGYLTTSNGYRLSALIQIPSDAVSMTINNDGEVLVALPDETELMSLGTIDLAAFVNPGALNPLGQNLYMPTQDSGEVYFGTAGENGFGEVEQGYLESSNVSLVEEMTDLVVAQRAYEVNARVIQASDQLMSIINDLRK